MSCLCSFCRAGGRDITHTVTYFLCGTNGVVFWSLLCIFVLSMAGPGPGHCRASVSTHKGQHSRVRPADMHICCFMCLSASHGACMSGHTRRASCDGTLQVVGSEL